LERERWRVKIVRRLKRERSSRRESCQGSKKTERKNDGTDGELRLSTVKEGGKYELSADSEKKQMKVGKEKEGGLP